MFSYEIIKNCISEYINKGAKSFSIYPFGDNGKRVKDILFNSFTITPRAMIDNIKSEKECYYININEFKKNYMEGNFVILTVENPEINKKMQDELLSFVPADKIINLLNYNKKQFIDIKNLIRNNLRLENILPNYTSKEDNNLTESNKIKVRVVHGHYPTWNVIKSICEEIIKDNELDLKLIIGWDKDPRCIKQAEDNNIPYELWDVYDAKYDKPDVLIVSQPYDYTTQVTDIKKYAKLVIVASVLLIRNTNKLELFWKVQENGFMRFNPDYYLCDSMLYNEIKGTNSFPVEIVEMGNAKYDGIYNACNSNVFPSKWNKIRNKKIILWTTDHGFFPDRITGVTFDLYVKAMFEYIVGNQNIGVIFRPHPVLLDELIKEGYWTGKELEEFIEWCNNSPNIIYDDSETYDNAYSVADAIIADAICGITVSALPTLKPICVTYRTKEDTPFHPELVDNYYAAHEPQELIEFIEMVIKGEDPMYSLRKATAEKFVKNFDGKNGYRIKEFLKEKYKEKINGR